MKRLLFFMAISTVLFSCEKIVATDITGKTPVLLLPQQDDTLQNNLVHFKWEEVEGAEKYHLVVVSPNFSNPSAYALDTIIYGTDFYYSLDSNQYELKFYGISATYHSDTIGPRQFWVGTHSSTSGNLVVLSSPDDLGYVNAINPQFQWDALPDASSYEISIRSGSDFETGSILDAQNNISTTVYTSPWSFTEGTYSWGVKGFINGSETVYSTRVLSVDLTNPNQATLSSPGDASLIPAGTITFSWANGTDPGTVHALVNSYIEIADDNTFTNILESQTIVGNSVSVNLTSGTYYWRVTNTDDAGNSAPVSSSFQLTVF
jgi:hypothetical protein